MASAQVSTGTPRRAGFSVAGFFEYASERFPLPIMTLLSLAIALAAYASAQGATLAAGAPLVLDAGAFGAGLMALLFVFLLRVYDEHKDFEHDALTRPDRPVQRGLITLAQLRVLGAVAVVVQLALAFAVGVEAGAIYLVVLGYSVLMYFEFFAKDWLAERFTVYAISHTVVMCLLVFALGMRVTAPHDLAIPVELWAMVALSLPAFYSIDVLRKIWAPQTEIDGVDSYTKLLGLRGAAVLGTCVLLATAGIGGWLGWRMGGRFIWLGVVAAVTAWGVVELAQFAKDPQPKREKRLEAVAGAQLLTVFFGIAIVAAWSHGAVLSIGSSIWTVLR